MDEAVGDREAISETLEIAAATATAANDLLDLARSMLERELASLEAFMVMAPAALEGRRLEGEERDVVELRMADVPDQREILAGLQLTLEEQAASLNRANERIEALRQMMTGTNG